ncbi:taste receptor type 1 member 3 [Pogona vitticeps]
MAMLFLLTVPIDWAFSQEKYCMSSQFRRPGDYMLGGLFPFTVYTGNNTDRILPDTYTGNSLRRMYYAGFIWALGMKLAVEEINNSTALLPGITLGYDLYDTCREPMVALQPSMLFLSRTGTHSIGVLCNYTDYETRVMAVIGPDNSELATVTAKLFSFFLIPQISYGATAEKMNNEELYPSFFRTVPSDKRQLEAMVQLLRVFQWNWIAIIGSDEEYGREGISLLSSMAVSYKICIAYEGIIPAEVTDPDLQSKLKKTISSINDTNVNVIVVFAMDRAVRELFKATLALGLKKKVWLATEAWVMSDVVTTVKNISAIGTVMGFVIKAGEIPCFEDYVYRLLEETQRDGFCQASQEEANKVGPDVLGPQCGICNNISRENVEVVLHHQQTFAVYAAVYGVAHALHAALRCSTGQCLRKSITSWQVLEELRTINFTVNNQSLHFAEDQSINLGFEVIGWKWKNNRIEHISLGEFNGNLTINMSNIQFHTEDRKAPRSECLTTCLAGQIRRMKGFHFCCYDCIDCESGTFRSSSDDSTCTPCPEHQWSPARSMQCHNRGEKYLFWSEPMTVALVLVLCFIVALICLLGTLFLKHLQTPAVQATGGGLCLVALLGLALLCTSTVLYIGKPTATVCRVQQPLLALGLNLCFSTITAKALQIMLAHDFADSHPNVLHRLIRTHPWALVAWSFLVEASFGSIYVYHTPASLVKNYKLLPTQVLFQCLTTSWPILFLLHGHNACLAFTSFLCTFMVQQPPKKYNAARGITFAMITYFITLVVAVPSYATVRPINQPAIVICSVLGGTLGLLVTYYLPKGYILWFKPEWNTSDYFQDYTKEKLQEKASQD